MWRRRPELPAPQLFALLNLVGEVAYPVLDLLKAQPVHVARLVDHACLLESSTDLGEHAAKLGPGQPNVGQRILAYRRHALRVLTSRALDRCLA